MATGNARNTNSRVLLLVGASLIGLAAAAVFIWSVVWAPEHLRTPGIGAAVVLFIVEGVMIYRFARATSKADS